jgi:hypothetical protein
MSRWHPTANLFLPYLSLLTWGSCLGAWGLPGKAEGPRGTVGARDREFCRSQGSALSERTPTRGAFQHRRHPSSGGLALLSLGSHQSHVPFRQGLPPNAHTEAGGGFWASWCEEVFTKPVTCLAVLHTGIQQQRSLPPSRYVFLKKRANKQKTARAGSGGAYLPRIPVVRIQRQEDCDF